MDRARVPDDTGDGRSGCHALVLRADQLEGCAEGSPEEAEFKAIADALEAYERRRWPDGKAPDRKD